MMIQIQHKLMLTQTKMYNENEKAEVLKMATWLRCWNSQSCCCHYAFKTYLRTLSYPLASDGLGQEYRFDIKRDVGHFLHRFERGMVYCRAKVWLVTRDFKQGMYISVRPLPPICPAEFKKFEFHRTIALLHPHLSP